ncbi:MAG: hypothetical protein ICV62_11185 [Cyanobacteria bacterium Co-bin13]|nr:hypothetical protein [Cyanobacteria bacterium Co-bin13]
MAPSDSRPGQLGPLNPGNVVSAGLRLYRDRFKMYLKLSAIAYLWLLGGVLGWALVTVALGGLLALIGNEVLGFLGVGIGLLLGLAPFLYGIAQFFMLSAVMSRLAFQQLIDQPETASVAQSGTKPKLWAFLKLGLLILLLLTVGYFALGIVATILGLLVGFLTGGILSAVFGSDIGAAFGVALGGLTVVAVVLIGLVWLVSRLSIAEVPLAIEPEITASDSISRSWNLTKTSVLRIQFVVVAAFLITLPFVVLSSYLPQIFMFRLGVGSTAYWTLYGVNLVLSFLGGMVTMPLWQTVKGVLYYDLRSRREGLDLQLRPSTDY